jgi:hypothetical protein
MEAVTIGGESIPKNPTVERSWPVGSTNNRSERSCPVANVVAELSASNLIRNERISKRAGLPCRASLYDKFGLAFGSCASIFEVYFVPNRVRAGR